MSKIYIYGDKGNMASRYRAILTRLGHEIGGEDVGGMIGFVPDEADAFIVATPTRTHCEVLHKIKRCGRPVLCEKPISKDLEELDRCLGALDAAGTKLSMVSQYDYLITRGEGDTVYDYFKTGSDGLAWDCINIIKHARGRITLRNESPYWVCQINGQALNIRDMDRAYIEMIEGWLQGSTIDLEAIRDAHLKVSAYIEANSP